MPGGRLSNPNRQQSLESARSACHFLRLYIESWIVDERIRAEITCLLDEFERLDAGEQARNAAGATQRRLNAKYGILGGRPKKTAKKRGKK
jgi:hypothetical protein